MYLSSMFQLILFKGDCRWTPHFDLWHTITGASLNVTSQGKSFHFSPVGHSHTFGHNFRYPRDYLVLRQPRSSSFLLLECFQSNRIFRRTFFPFQSMHPILWMYFSSASSWKWSRFDFLTWLRPDLPRFWQCWRASLCFPVTVALM